MSAFDLLVQSKALKAVLACVSSLTKKPLLHVCHSLEVEFMRLKDTLVTFLEETRQPTVKELREEEEGGGH